MLGLLFTAKIVRSSLIAVALKMEAIRSSETSALTKSTRRVIPEDGILHLHNSHSAPLQGKN
jgi:hypothetical protein